MMFTRHEREALREAHSGIDDDTWRKAYGWAIAQAANSADNPAMEAIGLRALREMLAESPG